MIQFGGPTRLKKPKNKTGLYKSLGTHIELFDEQGYHLGNVADWKALEAYGKKHGYFFAKELGE